MLAGSRAGSEQGAGQQMEILVDPDKELAEAKIKLASLRAQHKGRHPLVREQLRRVIMLEGLAHLQGPRMPSAAPDIPPASSVQRPVHSRGAGCS